MRWFSKKSESMSVDEFLEMSDKEISKILKTQKGVPYRTAKELRKAVKDDRRRVEGERGFAAMLDAVRGGGTGNRNYQNIPLKDRVHPAEYKRILQREAKRQGLL